MQNKNKVIRLIATIAVIAAVGLAAYQTKEQEENMIQFINPDEVVTSNWADKPIQTNPNAGFTPIDVPEFTLASSKGGELTKNDLKGTYSVIYFGFANCPDVCLHAMDGVTVAYDGLTEEEQQKVKVYFFSFDLERDTPEFLKNHLSAFNDAFIGAAGTGEYKLSMVKVLSEFDIISDKVNKAKGGFSFAHSNYTYLLDKEARFLSQYNYKTVTETPEKLTNDLRLLMTKQGS